MNTALLHPSEGDSITPQADTDAQIIALWPHGKKPHNQRAYCMIAHTPRPRDKLFLSLREKAMTPV